MKLIDHSLDGLYSHKSTLAEDQWHSLLTQIPNWTINRVDNIAQLQCHYRFENFMQAMAFASDIARLAEQVNHHPTLRIEWGKVCVCWWSHDLKGLHFNDFVMAAKTDQVFNNQ